MTRESHPPNKYQRMLLALFLVGQMACTAEIPVVTAGPEENRDDAIFYSVSVYDPARDPGQDLEATIEQTLADDKRILLEVGGEWCSWRKALDRYVHENRAVNSALKRGFLIMKVNFSEENRNADFLSAYPTIPGYPHLFVLGSDGTFLHSQGTAELEQGRSYNQNAFLAFLERWSPPY